MASRKVTIQEKLSKIQGELKAPKSQVNNFAGYSYRSAEDILNALKPLLAAQKLVIMINDDLVEIGGRVYIEATVTIQDVETLLELKATAFAREPMAQKGRDEAQITGASSSYARKYALNGLFAIDDTKDADSMEEPKTLTLAQAIASVSNAVNLTAVTALYNANQGFQNERTFVEACTKRRLELDKTTV